VAKARTTRKRKTSKKARRSSSKKKTRTGKKTATQKHKVSKKISSKKKKQSSKKQATKAATKKTPRKSSKKTVAKNKAVKQKVSKQKVAPSTKALPREGKPAAHAEPAKPAPSPLPTIEEAMAHLRYGEGSDVVHPKYGLGKVDRIVERTLNERTVPCLEIVFPYQEMKLTIPVDHVDRSGLRPPIGREESEDVFKVLRGRATFDAKRRSAKRVIDYRKRLSMGDPTSLAEAIRDLARLSLKKSLSYEERKILGTALRILSREVALARNREPDDVREEIEKIVYR